jgi:imidazoleglycerol phosphate dehydratase HisB
MTDPTLSARVELTRTAAEVEITLRNFLDARPRATRSTGHANVDHMKRWR